MINNCNQEHKTAFWLRRNKVVHTEIMDKDYDNVMPWKDILYKYDAYILFRAEKKVEFCIHVNNFEYLRGYGSLRVKGADPCTEHGEWEA